MDEFAAARALSDRELTERLEELAAADRRDEAELLIHVGEMDARDLSIGLGYPSLFHYCVRNLKFPESTAYWRIQAARAARKHHEILHEIRSGALNVTTVKLIEPYLSPENVEEIVAAARHKSRKDVEAYIASLAPSAPRRDVVTKQGPMLVAKAAWPPPAAGTPALDQRALDIVEALDAERRRLHFDVGPDTAQLLERAREILRHKYPFATFEDIVKEALNVLLDDKDYDRDTGGREGGKTDGRAIPMWVRREVWKRDGGRCVYVAQDGRACADRSWLEFDHVVPFARGGRSDDPGNVRLLCRAHNQAEARRAFGPAGSA
jgi:hypothetical protein